MAITRKKMAAALAAINLYLQEEEAAAREKLQQDEVLDNSFSAWRHSGRQDVMTMRRLVQLRTFTRM